MTSTRTAETPLHTFDDRNMRWYKLGDFEHFVFAMLDVDTEKLIVDFILKFPAHEQIFLHRHLALTNTLVVQGEHRLYEPDGSLQEIRPVGSYTSSPPGGPHREGPAMAGASSFTACGARTAFSSKGSTKTSGST